MTKVIDFHKLQALEESYRKNNNTIALNTLQQAVSSFQVGDKQAEAQLESMGVLKSRVQQLNS